MFSIGVLVGSNGVRLISPSMEKNYMHALLKYQFYFGKSTRGGSVWYCTGSPRINICMGNSMRGKEDELSGMFSSPHRGEFKRAAAAMETPSPGGLLHRHSPHTFRF